MQTRDIDGKHSLKPSRSLLRRFARRPGHHYGMKSPMFYNALTKLALSRLNQVVSPIVNTVISQRIMQFAITPCYEESVITHPPNLTSYDTLT